MKALLEVRLLKTTPYWGGFRRLSALFAIANALIVVANAAILAYLLSLIIAADSEFVELLPLLGIYLALPFVRWFLQGRSEKEISKESWKISTHLRQRTIQGFIDQGSDQLRRSHGKAGANLPLESSRKVASYLLDFLSPWLGIPYTLLIHLIAVSTAVIASGLTNFTIAFLLLIGLEIGWTARSLFKQVPMARDSVARLRGLEVKRVSEPENPPSEMDDSSALTSLGRIKELRWTDCLIEVSEDESVTFRWGIASSGKLTLITGQATSAKSRLMETLIGMHQPVQGRIFVETSKGTFRLTELDPSYWNEQLGWISIKPVFFPGTIEENLRLIKPRTTRQKMLEILSEAGITEESLPHGLATQIDTELSDGLLQCLALARILLKDPPIVIMEQRSSSPEGEAEVSTIDKLKALARNGKTVLLLSDSDYARTLADRIITIDSNDAEPQVMLESAV